MPSRLLPLLMCVFMAPAACGGAATQASPVADAPAASTAKAPAAVDVAALKAAQAAGTVTVVDVRTPQEFAEGHVPGAINIPVDTISSRLSELASHKEGELYLICRSGARSARAQGVLASAGFAHPINVTGGTLAWISAGYPVE